MSKMSNATKRILAAVLTMLLVFGMVPVSAIPTTAAETEDTDAVTVLVTDGGNPVSGAQVSFTITDGENAVVKNGTITTNATGSAEVLAKAEYKDGLKINGTVTKEGYNTADITDVAITSDDQSIEIALVVSESADITVAAVNREFDVDESRNPKVSEAVVLTGIKEGDEVSYQMNGDTGDVMPQISAVGKYVVTVSVKRDGEVIFTETVESEITPKTVKIDAEAIAGLVYNGNPRTLVKVKNQKELKDKYGVAIAFKTPNTGLESGEYTVRIEGSSTISGIIVEPVEVTATIAFVEISEEKFNVVPYDKAYDAAEHDAVTVNSLIPGVIKYQLGDEGEWTTTCPKIKEAGTYKVNVKLIPNDKAKYAEKELSCTAVVKKADREFKFSNDEFNVESSSKKAHIKAIDENGNITIDKTIGFNTVLENIMTEDKITYDVVVVGDEGAATINAGGYLTVTEPGTFKVTATLEERKNYNDDNIEHTITVTATNKYENGERANLIEFKDDDKIGLKDGKYNYYVNKNSNVIAEIAATSKVKAADEANITYSISPVPNEEKYAGISCDANTGKVYISDFDAFIASLNKAGGHLKVKVGATKSAGILAAGDTASYIINIQYVHAADSLFTLAMSLTGTGWISSEVTVNPKEGYSVTKAIQKDGTTIPEHDAIDTADYEASLKSVLDKTFVNNVKFGDDGQNKRTVYICDKDGYIYAPVDVMVNMNGSLQDLKIDRTSPDAASMEISYSAEKNSIVDTVKTLFYQDTVIVTIKATDEMSGVQRFTFEYDGKEFPVENFKSVDGKTAEATVTITVAEGEEYNSGKVTFTAYDRAGNATQKTGDETIVVDYVSPDLTVEYVNPINVVPDDATTSKRYYFNSTNDLVFKASVKETNGFKDNGIIRVLKDDKAFDDVYINHENADGFDVYTVRIPAEKAKEGIYRVKLYYEDKSTNKMTGLGVEDGVFLSDEMVIDVTNPKITLKYEENNKHDGDPCDDYTVKLTIREVNFDPATLEATTTAKNISGIDVALSGLEAYIRDAANWTSDGDTHVCVLTYGKDGVLPDAVYNEIKVACTDLAENKTEKGRKDFVIDTKKPTAPEIKYDKPIAQVILDATTFSFAKDTLYKFFKAPTKITLTSTDETLGVEKFVLKYNREGTASETNLASFEKNDIVAVQSAEKKNQFEATVTLPESITMEEFEQIRGNITAYAVDKHGNISDTVTDNGTVVVVDNVKPGVSVQYFPIDAPVKGNKTYYNDKITGVITVKEANFLPKTVTLSLTKDGAEVEAPAITWDTTKDENGNVVPDSYEGTFKIEGKKDHSTDGDYVVQISCVDKSTNKADEYKSDILVLDTISPVLGFSYKENDKHDNSKKGCDDYTVKLTVKEKNFDINDFVVTVNAEDIKGNAVIVNEIGNYIKDEANWTSDKGTHVCEFTYGKDGVLLDAIYKNINFSYTDLAKNNKDVDSKKFIIDTTAPTAPVITYQDSITSVVAEVLTLGLSDEIVYRYFDAPTTVTLTSTDATWGVKDFVLTYNREKGESKTNVKDLYVEAKATQSSTEKDVFTAEITLPKKEADQLRGSVSAYAIDKHGITSKTVNDNGNVIVVDTISPEMSVEYSETEHKVGTISYYNTDINGTITIKEANFYPEDVEILVTRDGVEVADPVIEWNGTVDADGNKQDVYKGTFTLPAKADHSTDGDYIVTITYKDRSTDLNKADSTKEMAEHVSNQLTIDTTAPVIKVSYENKNIINSFADPYIKGAKRNYFDDTQVATITIIEHNFNKTTEYNSNEKNANVINIAQKDIKNKAVKGTYVGSVWGDPVDDAQSMTITYNGDANYAFDMSCTDLAGNSATYGKTDYFTVDKTAPVVKVADHKDVRDIFLNHITFGYYKVKAELKVTATDTTSPVNIIDAEYTQTPGTSAVNKASENQVAISAEEHNKDATYKKAINYNHLTHIDNKVTATYTFVVPKGKLDKGNNMYGDIKFFATDRAGKKSNQTKDSVTGVIVDSIAPNVKIAYSKAYKNEKGIAYYDGKIVGTITINEANFDNVKEFNLAYTRDGAKKEIGKNLKWKATGRPDEYVATFTLTQDGDYIITASYTDKAGNKGEFNGKNYNYKSHQLTIDTKIESPVITFSGEAGAERSFSGDFRVNFSFKDDNYDSYQATLTRTRYAEKGVNVNEFISGASINVNGGSGSVTVDKLPENDGVYTLTVKMTDKVNHSSTTTATFIVNREGSVYVYSDSIVDLINGVYTQEIKEDLIITEYNANKHTEKSLAITVKKNGHIIDEITSTAPVKNTGWYEYVHTINRENFKEDGWYTIEIYAEDESGRKDGEGQSLGTFNTADKNTFDTRFEPVKEVLEFKVDTHRPEIQSIEFDTVPEYENKKTVVDADSAIVKMSIYDSSSFKGDIKILVDDKVLTLAKDGTTVDKLEAGEVIFEFNTNETVCTATFKLDGGFEEHFIGVEVKDNAGRSLVIKNLDDLEKVKDSITDDFTGAVLVSTNILAQLWSNQPVFWGIVGGVVGVAALAIILIFLLKKRKKKEDK